MPSMRPQIQHLTETMEKKLAANDHKRAWQDYGRSEAFWFLTKLREEVEELQEAMLRGTIEEIMLEAADVANFAMFVHDLASREGPFREP